MLSPLDGAPDASDASHPLCRFVPLTGCSNSSDPIGGFHLRTLSVASPSAIMGPILDTVVISHDVEGVSCEELGWHINSCLLCLFVVPTRAQHLASSVVTPRAIKLMAAPMRKLRHLAQSPIVSLPPSLRLK
jgi:hypothetical protein